MLHAVVRYELLCPAYCLMPDHAHVVWVGVAQTSDQRNAMKFLRTYTTPLLAPHVWQRQPFDNVLQDAERERGAFASTCHYVLENPVRKNLVRDGEQWAFSGAMVPGYPTLGPHDERFWELFWRIYGERVEGYPNS